MINLIIITFALFISFTASGMSVDKMTLFSTGNDDYFQVTNTTEYPLFVTTIITEKVITRDEVSEIKYTSDNINKWKINTSPSKFILYPKEKKVVYVNENLCIENKSCIRNKDAVFTIGFIPSVYVPKGKENKSDVGILFGFAPSFVLPADKLKEEYKFNIISLDDKDFLKFENNGNTMLTVMIDQCNQAGERENCSIHNQIYAGRHGKLELPLQYKKGYLRIKVLNGNETYVEDYLL